MTIQQGSGGYFVSLGTEGIPDLFLTDVQIKTESRETSTRIYKNRCLNWVVISKFVSFSLNRTDLGFCGLGGVESQKRNLMANTLLSGVTKYLQSTNHLFTKPCGEVAWAVK